MHLDENPMRHRPLHGCTNVLIYDRSCKTSRLHQELLVLVCKRKEKTLLPTDQLAVP
jgi:hypothetical protein